MSDTNINGGEFCEHGTPLAVECMRCEANNRADWLDALNARLEHAEKRFLQEQQEGDAVSIASTRASFLAWRDAIELVNHHLSTTAKTT